MTATMSDSMFKSAAQLSLPELLSFYEGSVQLVIKSWEALCDRAISLGVIDELHSQHDECEWSFRQGIEGIDRSLSILNRNESSKSNLMTIRLNALRDQLATKYAELFPKWQTIDDLEELLLARMMVPNEKLIAWAKQNPKSAEDWYNAPDDAFPPRG